MSVFTVSLPCGRLRRRVYAIDQFAAASRWRSLVVRRLGVQDTQALVRLVDGGWEGGRWYIDIAGGNDGALSSDQCGR